MNLEERTFVFFILGGDMNIYIWQQQKTATWNNSMLLLLKSLNLLGVFKF